MALLAVPTLVGATLATGLEDGAGESIRLINNAASLTFGGTDLANYLTIVNSGNGAITEPGGVLRMVHNNSTLTTNRDGTAPGVQAPMPSGEFEITVKVSAEDTDEGIETVALKWMPDPAGDPDTFFDAVMFYSAGTRYRASRSYKDVTPNPNISAAWNPTKPFWLKIARDADDALSSWYKQNLADPWDAIAGDERTDFVGAGTFELSIPSEGAGNTGHTIDIDQIDGLKSYLQTSPVATLASFAFTSQIDPSDAELTMSELNAGTEYADTTTDIKLRYRVDSGAWSSWLTFANYKLETAFTPSTDVDFEFQFNSDGVQQLQIADFAAGSFTLTATTPPAVPTLTLGTLSGLTIPITADGDAGATHTLKLIRRLDGVVIDTQTGVGDGVINLTATTRPTWYDVVGYSTLGGLNSTDAFLAGGVLVPAASSPTGAMNLLVSGLRDLIAASSAYQALVGASTAVEALDTIHAEHEPAEGLTDIFSVVSHGDDWSEDRHSEGAGFSFNEEGMLSWNFEAKMALDVRTTDRARAIQQFKTDLYNVWSDMKALAGTVTAGVAYLRARRISFEHPPTMTSESQEAQGIYHFQAIMAVEYD